jgi:hypothetical protein
MPASPQATITLSRACREIPAPAPSLRRALDRFQLIEHGEGGQRILPQILVEYFRAMRATTGYLYAREIRTRDALLAAAANFIATPRAKPQIRGDHRTIGWKRRRNSPRNRLFRATGPSP